MDLKAMEPSTAGRTLHSTRAKGRATCRRSWRRHRSCITMKPGKRLGSSVGISQAIEVAEHRLLTHFAAVRHAVVHPDDLPLLAAAGDFLSAVYVLTRLHRSRSAAYDQLARSSDGGRTVNGLVHLRGEHDHARVVIHSSIEWVWPSRWYAFWGAWVWSAGAAPGGEMGEHYLDHVAGREVRVTSETAVQWLLDGSLS